ncbi:MAG TPA: cupin domain-containing protein [Conexibacter sp.]|nr:cupin domain-containing protein [Conexibacter sp.]
MPYLNVSALAFDHDSGDPEGFRAGTARLGPQLGARESGVTVYELPPGQAVCPYHYEYGEEEWLLVLEGRPSLRTPAGIEQLAPGAIAFFPRGPDGAHQVRNDGDEPARVAMFSTVVLPTATAYPDSDKVGVYVGDAEHDHIFRRSTAVEYFDGETGG